MLMSLPDTLKKQLQKENITKADLKKIFNRLNTRHLQYSDNLDQVLAYYALAEKFRAEKRYQDIKNMEISASEINELIGKKLGLGSFASY